MRHFLIAALAAFVLATAPVSGARAGTACDQSDTDCINTLVSDIEAQIGVGPVPWERILMALGAREATNAVMTLRQMRTWVRIYQGSNVVNGAVHLPIMERVLATLEAWDGAPPPQVVQNPPPNDPPVVPENNNDPQQPVVVENNDPQPTVVENSDPQPELPANAVTVEEVEAWRDNPKFAGNTEHIARWNRVLAALGVDNGAQPMTAADAQEFADKGWAPWVRTAPTLAALEALEAWRQGQGQNQQSSPAEVPARTATLNPDGTIPVQVFDGYQIDTFDFALARATGPDTTLTVGSDGTLTMTGDGGSISKSVCINPSAGCAAPTERFPDGSLGSRAETFVQKVRPYREVRGRGFKKGTKIPLSYISYHPQQGYLPGWTISRFGKGSYDDAGGHWGTYQEPVYHTVTRTLPGKTYTCMPNQVCQPEGGPNVQFSYTFPDITRTYREISHYETRYRNTPNVPRWFVAAKHDGGESYRAFGYWLLNDTFAVNNQGWRVVSADADLRVFAAGTDPATDVSGVSGSATYRGEAAGAIRFQAAGLHYATFEGARTDLTANFGSMQIDGKVYLQGENSFNTHVRDSLQPADGHVNPNLSLDHLRTILPNNL